MVSAHSSQVTALSFSPDDRVLASYSFGDSKICFWQVTNKNLYSELFAGSLLSNGNFEHFCGLFGGKGAGMFSGPFKMEFYCRVSQHLSPTVG